MHGEDIVRTALSRWARRLRMAAAAALLLAPGLVVAQVGDAWDWPLPPRRFSGLAQDERLIYSKAEDLPRQKSYEAAAAEFEKFAVQNPKSPVRSHCLLLRAYAQQMAHQRNTAIQAYQELLDFFAEYPDDAAPATFLMGECQIENGNVEAGIRTLKTLAANEKYLQQPIADVALNRLADYALAHNDKKGAEASWRKVLELYANAFVRPEGGAKEARTKLTDLYLLDRRYSALEEVFAQNNDDPKKLLELGVYVYDRALADFGAMDAATRMAFFKWFTGRRSWFSGAGQTGDFLCRSITVAVRAGAKEDGKEFIKEALAACRGAGENGQALYWSTAERMSEASRAGWDLGPQWKEFADIVLGAGKALASAAQTALYGGLIDRMRMPLQANSPAEVLWEALVARSLDICQGELQPDRDQGLAALVDRLRNVDRVDRAFTVADKIEDGSLAQWKRVELFGYQQKFVEMAQACDELEKMPNKELSIRALKTRASLYKDRLARYEDAIKLYSEINDPPQSTWAIVECYEKSGQPEKAVGACSEIEGFFEKDAPSAGFRKAEIWDRAGDSKKAIAACRAVLKKYPKHPVSSQAHQMLERYGIKTGGGVIEGEE